MCIFQICFCERELNLQFSFQQPQKKQWLVRLYRCTRRTVPYRIVHLVVARTSQLNPSQARQFFFTFSTLSAKTEAKCVSYIQPFTMFIWDGAQYSGLSTRLTAVLSTWLDARAMPQVAAVEKTFLAAGRASRLKSYQGRLERSVCGSRLHFGVHLARSRLSGKRLSKSRV